MRSVFLIALVTSLCASTAAAGLLPASLTFDGDTPGLPPATGGLNQPTEVFGSDGTVLVQSSAYGIASQPLVLHSQYIEGVPEWVGARYTFDSFTTGVLRVESTIAFDDYASCLFLEVGSSTDALVARLNADPDGGLRAWSTPLGTYRPDQPFRVRIDVDLTSQTWGAVVDAAMDGFADDPVVSGLPFANPGWWDVGIVYADVRSDFSGDTRLAYDNVAIHPVPVPGGVLLGIMGLSVAGWRLRCAAA